jgi:hypothetical protein
MVEKIDIFKKKIKPGNARCSRLSLPFKCGTTAVGLATVLIICLLSLFYLVQANRTATYGYEIEKYDNKLSELKKERASLELEAAKLRSTNQIKENLEKINMWEVDPAKISYYEIEEKILHYSYDWDESSGVDHYKTRGKSVIKKAATF